MALRDYARDQRAKMVVFFRNIQNQTLHRQLRLFKLHDDQQPAVWRELYDIQQIIVIQRSMWIWNKLVRGMSDETWEITANAWNKAFQILLD